MSYEKYPNVAATNAIVSPQYLTHPVSAIDALVAPQYQTHPDDVPSTMISNGLYWLDVDSTTHNGDGTEITAASDRSGRGNTIVNGASGEGPLYKSTAAGGAPTMNFNARWLKTLGTSQPVVAHLNGQNSAAREFTVITVHQERHHLVGIPWSWGKSTASTRHLTCRYNSNAYKPQTIGGTTSGVQPTLDAATIWEHTCPKVYTVRRSGGGTPVIRHRIDGVNQTDVSWTWIGNYDVDTFSPGATNNPTPTKGNELYISDVLVFDIALSDAQVAEWEIYFRQRRVYLFWKAGLGATGSWLIVHVLGQSNAMGFCTTSSDYTFNGSDTYYMALDGYVRPLVARYADGANDVSANLVFSTPVGPGWPGAFVQRLRERGETRPILIVPQANISTDSVAWKTNLTASPPTTNDLIGLTKHRVRDALKAPGSKLLCVIDQGEANCDTLAEAQAWDEDWALICDELVTYIGSGNYDKAGARFVLGRLSVNISGVGAFAADVRASQDALDTARSDMIKVQRPDGTCEASPGLHLIGTEQQSYGVILANAFADV